MSNMNHVQSPFFSVVNAIETLHQFTAKWELHSNLFCIA